MLINLINSIPGVNLNQTAMTKWNHVAKMDMATNPFKLESPQNIMNWMHYTLPRACIIHSRPVPSPTFISIYFVSVCFHKRIILFHIWNCEYTHGWRASNIKHTNQRYRIETSYNENWMKRWKMCHHGFKLNRMQSHCHQLEKLF